MQIVQQIQQKQNLDILPNSNGQLIFQTAPFPAIANVTQPNSSNSEFYSITSSYSENSLTLSQHQEISSTEAQKQQEAQLQQTFVEIERKELTPFSQINANQVKLVSSLNTKLASSPKNASKYQHEQTLGTHLTYSLKSNSMSPNRSGIKTKTFFNLLSLKVLK